MMRGQRKQRRLRPWLMRIELNEMENWRSKLFKREKEERVCYIAEMSEYGEVFVFVWFRNV